MGYGNNRDNQGKIARAGLSCPVRGNGHPTHPVVGQPGKSSWKGNGLPMRNNAEVQPVAPMR